MNATEINLNVVTIGDCLDLHKYKETSTIINDGKVIKFVEE